MARDQRLNTMTLMRVLTIIMGRETRLEIRIAIYIVHSKHRKVAFS